MKLPSEAPSDLAPVSDKKEIPQIVPDTKKPKKKHSISPIPLSRIRYSFSSHSPSGSSESGSNTPKTSGPNTPKTPSSDRPSKSLSASESPRKMGKPSKKRLISSFPESALMETFPFDRNLVEMEAAKLPEKEDAEAQQFFVTQDDQKYEFFNLSHPKRIYYLDRKKIVGGDPLQCTVYKVKNITMGYTLSGKAYVLEFSSSGREKAKKLRENEIKILDKMGRYYGHIELPKEAFIIFQTYYEGMDWSQIEKTESLFTLKIIIGCMEAGIYVQKLGILYRDYKPSNFVVKGDGTVKLIDFETAVVEKEVDETTLKYCIGSFGYHYKGLLPSKMEDRIPYSKQADWWVLGGVVIPSRLIPDDYIERTKKIKIASVVYPEQILKFLREILCREEYVEEEPTPGRATWPTEKTVERTVYKQKILPKLKEMSQAFFHDDEGLKYAKKTVKELKKLYIDCESSCDPRKKQRGSRFFDTEPVKQHQNQVEKSTLEVREDIKPDL